MYSFYRRQGRFRYSIRSSFTRAYMYSRHAFSLLLLFWPPPHYFSTLHFTLLLFPPSFLSLYLSLHPFFPLSLFSLPRTHLKANEEVFFYKDGLKFFRSGDLGRIIDNKVGET